MERFFFFSHLFFISPGEKGTKLFFAQLNCMCQACVQSTSLLPKLLKLHITHCSLSQFLCVSSYHSLTSSTKDTHPGAHIAQTWHFSLTRHLKTEFSVTHLKNIMTSVLFVMFRKKYPSLAGCLIEYVGSVLLLSSSPGALSELNIRF